MSPALGIIASGYQESGAPPFTPGSGPVYVQSVAAAATTVSTISVTFGAGVQTGDLIYFYISNATATPNITTLTSGWINVLGGTTKVASSANACWGLYHIVTSGENGTTAFSVSGFSTTITGNVLAVVLRNVYSVDPIDNYGSTFSSTVVTPFVLASIPGTGSLLYSNSLVISGVNKDGTGTFTTPTGFTQRQTSNTNVGAWLGTRDALTTANTDVAATNITPSASDEYCSLSVAFTSAAATPSAIRFSAAGDYQVAATGLNGTDLTWCCWAKMVVDRTNYSAFLGADNAGANYYTTTTDSTREIRQETNSPTTRTLHNMVVGTWYFLAFVHNNASGVADIYWKAAGGSMQTANRASGSIGPAASTTFRIGRDGFNSWLNGSIAAVSVWTAALSSTEIAAEADKYSPVRTSNLWANWTFKNGVQTNDESGNGRTLTATGTTPTTDASGPPIT